MLMKKRRLKVNATYQEFIELILQTNHYVVQHISPRIADIAINLPAEVNKYPADRLIAATSIAMGIPLVTADKNLRTAASIVTTW